MTQVADKIDISTVYYNFAWTVIMVTKHKKRKVIWPDHHESVIADTAESAISLATYNVRKRLEVLHIKSVVPESIACAFYRFGEYESLTREEKEQIPFPESFINPEPFQRK